jgi:hypothetical protein
MYRYLHHLEQPTAPSQHHREESISATARPHAVSCGIRNEDDVSGILRHHFPMTSLRTIDSDDAKQLIEKKRAMHTVGISFAVGIPVMEHERLLKSKVTVKIKVPQDACSQLDEQEPTIIRRGRGLEKLESRALSRSGTSPPAFHQQLMTALCEVQPRAFRDGGHESPSALLKTHHSEGTLLTTATNPLVSRHPEVLINAERVSNGADSPSMHKGDIVEALPLEEYKSCCISM